MTAGVFTLVIEQGATLSKTFKWRDEVGTPIDLTGYTGRAKGRVEEGAVATLFDLTTENGGVVINGPTGLITLTLTAAATAALDFDNGVYDLEVVSPVGVVTRLLKGQVVLDREVTV